MKNSAAVLVDDQAEKPPDAIARLERLHQRLLRHAAESFYGTIRLRFEKGVLVELTTETNERAEDL